MNTAPPRDFIVFAGGCGHLEAGVEADVALVLGVWTKLSVIPGWSFSAGGGIFDVGGVDVQIVSNHEGIIGATIGFGIGEGGGVGAAACCTFCGYHGRNENVCKTDGSILGPYDQCDVGKLIQSNPIWGPFIG